MIIINSISLSEFPDHGHSFSYVLIMAHCQNRLKLLAMQWYLRSSNASIWYVHCQCVRNTGSASPIHRARCKNRRYAQPCMYTTIEITEYLNNIPFSNTIYLSFNKNDYFHFTRYILILPISNCCLVILLFRIYCSMILSSMNLQRANGVDSKSKVTQLGR